MTLSYDQLPYPSYAYGATHPDTLATLATLLGISPAPVEHCRVLELGCASGGNLIPMALELPQSEFLGIDYSLRQITEGQVALAALELGNIELRRMNILEVNADLGQFDYIIAHGVFSWVPEPVRDKILAICRENLASSGVAYVSYNTYPGCYMHRGIREMMLYHIRNVAEPQMRVTQARTLLEFLAESMPADVSASASLISAYSNALHKESERWESSSDSALFHDRLAEVNEPIYFYQFAERAAQHGLQYLADADFSATFLGNLPPPVRSELFKLAHSLVELEQYIDFVLSMALRRSLLVRQEVSIERSIQADRVRTLCAASPAMPVSSSPDISSGALEQFQGADGATLSTDHPVIKAAMLVLGEMWPQGVPFDALLNAAYSRLGADALNAPERRARDAQMLCSNLLKSFTCSDRLVELHSYVPRLVTRASERPVASPWARYLAQQSCDVTNLRHENVELTERERYLLRQLDGSRDRTTLLDDLDELRAKRRLAIERDGALVQDAQEAREIMAADMEHDLGVLAQAALLVA